MASIFKKIGKLLKGPAKSVETFALNELDKAIIAAKQTEIGLAASEAIHIVDRPGLSGADKMLKAVAIVAPVVVSYVSRGGLSALVDDAEEFARSVIESTLADTRETKAVSIGKVILALLEVV